MKKSKTVFLFFVEGPSEQEALEAILDVLFDSSKVIFKVVHGDFTADINVSNPIAFLGKSVQSAINGERGINLSDLEAAVVVADTDGCYIDDSCVIEDPTKDKAFYTFNQIYHKVPDSIKERNNHKRRNLNQISSKAELSIKRIKVPLETYYASCNLDHLLYDENNLTNSQKEEEAIRFGDRYEGREEDFIPFIFELFPSSCDLDYNSSWEEVKKGTNSLRRMSNFICFIIRHSDLLNPEAKKVLDSLLSKEEDE